MQRLIQPGVRHRRRIHDRYLGCDHHRVRGTVELTVINDELCDVVTGDISYKCRIDGAWVGQCRRRTCRGGSQRPAEGQRITFGVGGAATVERHDVTHADILIRPGVRHRCGIHHHYLGCGRHGIRRAVELAIVDDKLRNIDALKIGHEARIGCGRVG